MPEDVFVYLGQCLRDAREECGLTQQELADQTGRGLRHLQDIEKGRKNPSYDVLASFIKRLLLMSCFILTLRNRKSKYSISWESFWPVPRMSGRLS